MSTRRPVKPKIKPPKKIDAGRSFEDSWQRLSVAIKEIQNHNASNLSFEETYRSAYTLVLHKNGDKLYDGLSKLTVSFLRSLTRRYMAHDITLSHTLHSGESFLKSLLLLWNDHIAALSKLRDVLKYMDKVYTPSNNVANTWELGLNLFRDHVLFNSETCPDIQPSLFNAIHSQIHLERDGCVINRSVLKSCCDILLGLSLTLPNTPSSYVPPSDSLSSLYNLSLEPQLELECVKYYNQEASNFLASNDIPSYLRRVEDRLIEESNRCSHYLSLHTAPIYQHVLENELLTNKIPDILSQLVDLIENDAIQDLSRLHNLFHLIPTHGPPALRKAIKEDVIRRGQAINSDVFSLIHEPKNDSKKPPSSDVSTLNLALQWVKQTLQLKLKFDNLWQKAFKHDEDVQTYINEGFENFVNMNTKASEFISLFIDDNLKKGLKGKSEDEADEVLDQTIVLFRFLVDKDVFEVFYKRHLARRLIQGRSVSDDAERGMLAKLKVECGVQFTQKMEGMFNDMRTSADNMRAYKNHLSNKEKPSDKAELNVNVLTASYWPMPAQVNTATLPDVMTRMQQQYERFYLQRHSGRRMLWQVTQGTVDMKVEYQERKYDVNVSTLGAIILLLFDDVEDGKWLKYSDILSTTNIPENELKRNLQTLACGKYKLLEKDPKGKEVRASDSFRVNLNFSSPLAKIKIATIANRVETSEERKETDEKVEEERKHQTDACVVRIMKSRKQASHNEIVIEASKMLGSRFAPTPQAIKKRIEALIEREYLERTENRMIYRTDFKTLKLISKGQFGTIQLAKCRLNGSFYALKVMNKGFSRRHISYSNPHNERSVHLLALTHKSSHCMPMISAFQTDTDLLLQLPLASNGTLLELLEMQDEKTLPAQTIRNYGAQLLAALHWLHDDVHWLHRDLKPQNMLIASDDHLLLTDFGAATALLDYAGVQRARKIDSVGLVGTPDYVSPEILLAAEEYLVAEQANENDNVNDNEKDKEKDSDNSPGLYGPESDWWSFGVVLYELAFGITPFFAESVGETYNRIKMHQYALGDDQIHSRSDDDLRALLVGLFKPQTERLGYSGTEQVKHHVFFRGVDWNGVEQRAVPSTYYDHTLDELVEGSESEGNNTPPQDHHQKTPQNAFDFSALFQAANSVSGSWSASVDDTRDKSSSSPFTFTPSNEWMDFDYIPTVENLFPHSSSDTHTSNKANANTFASMGDTPLHAPETPFKLSFHNIHTSTNPRSRNVSEEQAFLEMQQCVGLSAKKRLDWTVDLAGVENVEKVDMVEGIPRTVSYSSDLSSVDDNTQADAGGYRESPLKRVESRSSLGRMNSQISLSRLSAGGVSANGGATTTTTTTTTATTNARPLLSKQYKSSPNIRSTGTHSTQNTLNTLKDAPSRPTHTLSSRASSSRLTKSSSRFSALGDLPEMEKSENIEKIERADGNKAHPENAIKSPPPKTLNWRMDSLKKRHDALLKDLNQTSRRHEKLLAKSSSRQSLK
ncbi:hypothetical protein E3P96_02482 [Wallemia ichthyophaga]|nr:hypothetical protein E3P96_02482 [Wallemia ichthyophaga]